MSLAEFIAQWRMLLAISPVRCLEYFRMMGCAHESAHELAQLVGPTSTTRTVYQVIVTGSSGCGKSELLSTLNNGPVDHSPLEEGLGLGLIRKNVAKMMGDQCLVLRELGATAVDKLGEHLDELQETPAWHNCDLVCICLLYASPSPRDRTRSRMPSSA
eukprot:TRINITY_DN3777_c0_g2_i2.p1 TRINITY_DN3777_c0_g2~~TRINITY_DN3777_c0_g2_i2.p1  ORF type:complete len:159 (+),score=18.03 TRINITY_DN3777_c0_g2_i2:349-825(+)